jgi:5-methylcytosine-specific restriction endonuclease McrA
MAVFVLDKNNNPLMPCSEKRAHQLLDKHQAVAVRRTPFVIKLLDYVSDSSATLRLKLDPGSKITGMALLDNSKVVWLGELHHRTNISSKLEDRASLRRGRRSRNTRYRSSRFDNRKRPEGWLAPSLEARVNQVLNVVIKLCRYAPISALSLELVKFDMQKMDNPEISGVEYQQGELWGYEVRAYIQEKFHHKCVYCGKADYDNHDRRYEIDHVQPRSRGGPDKVSNLVYACKPCNDKKGNKTAAEFGHPEVLRLAKSPLKDAAAINSVRWRLFNRLKELGLEIETGTGGRTKFNRSRLGLPKSHCIDAVCVGASTPDKIDIKSLPQYFEVWTAKGRGNRERDNHDKYGFRRRKADGEYYAPKTCNKRVKGFAVGDIVKDHQKGEIKRLVRARDGKGCTLVQRADGWQMQAVAVLEKVK